MDDHEQGGELFAEEWLVEEHGQPHVVTPEFRGLREDGTTLETIDWHDDEDDRS